MIEIENGKQAVHLQLICVSEKQGWKCTTTEYYKDGTVCTKFYEAPCKSISIGKYERPKRNMSEEQIEKMQKAREKSKDTSQI